MRQFVENVFAAVETDIAVGAVMLSYPYFSEAKYTAGYRQAKTAKNDKNDIVHHTNCRSYDCFYRLIANLTIYIIYWIKSIPLDSLLVDHYLLLDRK